MRVRCISPHGGGHHGLDDDGEAVPPGFPGRLAHPPNAGGYVSNAALSPYPIAVGSELDAPDGYVPDGFHFEAAAGPPPPLPEAPAVAAAPAFGLPGKGDI